MRKVPSYNMKMMLYPISRMGNGFLICVLSAALLGGGLARSNSQTSSFDYSEPKLLVGSIYPLGNGSGKILFKSIRKGARTGSTALASCDYVYPDGSLAARDQIVYEAGQLSSFTEEELQTGEKGSALIRPDPKNPGKRRIYFEYTTGQAANARTSSSSEALENDTLIDDMIPVFIVARWADLEHGLAARFRYIVLSRKETVGFKLVKDLETTWHGQPAIRIKMEPTSFLIAQLVDPLFFTVEKGGGHRILEYTGRTTPLVKNGNKWKDLDASCVFDWQHQEVANNGERAKP
jgi:hypothetical protein